MAVTLIRRGHPRSLLKLAGSCKFPGVAIGIIVSAAIVAFGATLNIPFLHDSYGHVANASKATLADITSGFYRHPETGDFFFRPLGYLGYWLDFQWASFSPLRWNLWSLTVHTVNSLLVCAIARQLSIDQRSAILAGLLFAIHGSRPEVVSWIAARFDLLAALFVLLSLFAFNRYSETEKRTWFVLTLACCPLALLSKESAFCLPLLLAGVLPFRETGDRRKLVRLTIYVLGISAIGFMYRYWVLRGIGGYRTPSGGATILQFSLIHALKGLFFREWALLFFPVNWSVEPGVIVKLAVLLSLCALLGALLYSRAQRSLLIASLLLVLAASLPAQHLLLLRQDLNGSRVLYLPVFGLSLFCALFVSGCRDKHVQLAIGIGLLSSELVFLEHNLAIWRDAALLSQKTCHSLGEELSRTPGNIAVSGLPATWHGAYFLKNGFPECVAMNSHVSARRVLVQEDTPLQTDAARHFTWNDKLGRLQEQPQ